MQLPFFISNTPTMAERQEKLLKGKPTFLFHQSIQLSNTFPKDMKNFSFLLWMLRDKEFKDCHCCHLEGTVAYNIAF